MIHFLGNLGSRPLEFIVITATVAAACFGGYVIWIGGSIETTSSRRRSMETKPEANPLTARDHARLGVQTASGPAEIAKLAVIDEPANQFQFAPQLLPESKPTSPPNTVPNLHSIRTIDLGLAKPHSVTPSFAADRDSVEPARNPIRNKPLVSAVLPDETARTQAAKNGMLINGKLVEFPKVAGKTDLAKDLATGSRIPRPTAVPPPTRLSSNSGQFVVPNSTDDSLRQTWNPDVTPTSTDNSFRPEIENALPVQEPILTADTRLTTETKLATETKLTPAGGPPPMTGQFVVPNLTDDSIRKTENPVVRQTPMDNSFRPENENAIPFPEPSQIADRKPGLDSPTPETQIRAGIEAGVETRKVIETEVAGGSSPSATATMDRQPHVTPADDRLRYSTLFGPKKKRGFRFRF